jgi:hypothetical protein
MGEHQGRKVNISKWKGNASRSKTQNGEASHKTLRSEVQRRKTKCSRMEKMASLLFTEKGGWFAKDGVSSSAQNRGRTTCQLLMNMMSRILPAKI